MPFSSCSIEPVNLSRRQTSDQESLESVANVTLANAIRQLSSLSVHATRIMNELGAESARICSRAEQLNKRIERLAEHCTRLDYLNDPIEVHLEDIKPAEAFTSQKRLDLNVLNRTNMPESMRLLYERAEPAPALHLLSPHREDSLDCARFYSDPDFFFNHWCNQLLDSGESKDLVKKLRRERRKGQKKPQNEPNQVKTALKAPIDQPDQIEDVSSILADTTLGQDHIDEISSDYNMNDSFTETETSSETILQDTTSLPVLSSTPLPPTPPLPDELNPQESQEGKSFLDDIKSGKFVLKSNVKLITPTQ